MNISTVISRLLVISFLLTMATFAQTSKKMTQIAHLTLNDANGTATKGNAGIWGWVGSDGTEYALPTTQRPGGIAIVSLKDPRNPKQLFHLKSPDGGWQELLTVRNFLYKCADQGDSGLQIWDLSPLPASIPKSHPSWKELLTCHSLWSDTLVSPHRLYLEGNGDIKILSLENPSKPVSIGRVLTSIHDGMARGNRLYVSTGPVGTMDIWDATKPMLPVRIGSALISKVSDSLGEPKKGYSHNVWLTEDSKYAFTTEETDSCTLKMWDITNEKSPRFTGGKFLANFSTQKMAHNVFVRKHLAYLSHYGLGVRVIDFKDPSKLVEVGFHNPGGSSWGCFPWLPSGLIIHGNEGLRVVDPDPDIKIVGGTYAIQKFDPNSRFNIVSMNRKTFGFQLPEFGVYSLTLSNISGQEVFQIHGNAYVKTQRLELNQLANGNYQVRLKQGKREFNGLVGVGLAP